MGIGRDGLNRADHLARQRRGLLPPGNIVGALGFGEGLAKTDERCQFPTVLRAPTDRAAALAVEPVDIKARTRCWAWVRLGSGTIGPP